MPQHRSASRSAAASGAFVIRTFSYISLLLCCLILGGMGGNLWKGLPAFPLASVAQAAQNVDEGAEADLHLKTAHPRKPVAEDAAPFPTPGAVATQAAMPLGVPENPAAPAPTALEHAPPKDSPGNRLNGNVSSESPEADDNTAPPALLGSAPNTSTFPPIPDAANVEPSQRKPWVAIVYELNESDASSAFIANARGGAQQALEELRTPFIETRITRAQDRDAVLGGLADKGYKLIIAIGYQLVPTIISQAEKHPETRFTLIDGMVPPLFNNVQSIAFKDHEGAFLVGMLAAFSSRSKQVGFIGGMDVPVIRNFAVGFQQGVRFVDPDIQIQTEFVGNTADSNAWSNPEKAEKIARTMYKGSVDVIFAAAGSSGVGVLRAAKDTDRLAIGVDSNQNYLYPGTVLTSMVKRVDRAVYDTILAAKEGDWQPGIKYLGVKENALDYSIDRNNRALITQQMIDALENAKDMINRGAKVVDSYQP